MVDESEQERKQICSAIGERMRRARKENDITLDILSQRTGFSKSYLSQIENMKREPTIGTLTKIAYAMNIDALFLISGLQQEAEGREFTVVRANERKVMPDAFRLKGLKYESLAHKKHDRLMDAYIVEMGPDFPQNTKPWQGQEFTFVLEGTHEFVYDGKSHLMNEGDAYYFDSTKPYKGRRIGAKPARILVVFTSTEGKTGLRKRREGRPAGRSPQTGRS
jgi:transcriptional regulator with XRE-family HTH domain